jgi:hypothetical protein
MLVTFKELRRIFGIPFTRQHVLRLEKLGRFPLRRKVGNVNFWTREEIEAWLRDLRRPTAPSQ